jgi:hypothetical protein
MKRDHDASRRIFKWIAALTLQAFISSNLFFTNPAEILAQEIPMSAPIRSSEAFLKIPVEFGKFDGLFNPLTGNQSVFFFHIKDAHASGEAQGNIARILTRLYERKQLDLVLVEGASGSLVPERLDVFKDPQKNAAYKKDLFHAGLLNGAAYFVAAQKGVSSYGLEEPGVYFDHLQIFRHVVAARPGAEKFFNTVEVLMMNTFKNILRMDIFVFLKEWKMQHQKELSWGRYLPFLIRSAEKFLGLDLQDYRAQVAWPNLVRFRHVDLLQDQIHSQAVQKEFREVSKALERERDPALRQTMTLLASTLESQTAIIRETPDFRKYVEVLVEACRREGVLLQQYPNLVRYLAFRIFRSEIESEGLLAEVERLEDSIFDKLFSKGKMRGIISAYRDFFLLKRAFGLELDRSESKRFLALDIEQKVRQFSKISQGYDLQENNVIRGANLVKQFYIAAQKRDGVFMEQVKNSLEKAQVFPDRPFFIALVTGGYHAEGIEKWFRAEGLPFASIQPSFKDEPKTDRYENLLLGNYRTTDTLAPAQGSIEPDAMAEKLMGRDAFLALRSAEANIRAKHGAVRFQNPISLRAVRPENRSTDKGEIRRVPELAGRSEVRSAEKKGMLRRRFTLMLAFAVAGLLSGCGTLRHDDLKLAMRNAEEFTLPRSSVVVPAAIRVDSQSLLLKVIENDPKVKKAEFEIAIKEIEKDRLKGSWSIVSDVAWVDGKPVFSVGVKGMIPHLLEGGVTGLGVGSIASLALDLASSLGSVLRGEPLLATTLAEKVAEIAKLNHQRVISERYEHYAVIALEIRKLQEQIETAEHAAQALNATLSAAQERKETSELEMMKIREMQTRWHLRADEYRSLLKAKEAELLNLYAPGASGRTEFVIGLYYSKLPAGWEASPEVIRQLREDVTRKTGTQLPSNRELAAAYKGREAAVVTRALEHARGRFSFSIGGLGHIDDKSNTDFNPGKINEAVNRRYQAKNSAGAGFGLTGGPAADVDERVAAGGVEITESILLDVQRTIEDEISRLAYQIEENQKKIGTQTAGLRRLKADIDRARKAQVAGRRLVTEDKLAEFISGAWEYQLSLIEERAETGKAVLQLEVAAGVLGDFAWRNVGGGRPELRASKVPLLYGNGSSRSLPVEKVKPAEFAVSSSPRSETRERDVEVPSANGAMGSATVLDGLRELDASSVLAALVQRMIAKDGDADGKFTGPQFKAVMSLGEPFSLAITRSDRGSRVVSRDMIRAAGIRGDAVTANFQLSASHASQEEWVIAPVPNPGAKRFENEQTAREGAIRLSGILSRMMQQLGYDPSASPVYAMVGGLSSADKEHLKRHRHPDNSAAFLLSEIARLGAVWQTSSASSPSRRSEFRVGTEIPKAGERRASTHKTRGVQKSIFSSLKLFLGIAALFFFLTVSAFAGTSGAQFKSAEKDLQKVVLSIRHVSFAHGYERELFQAIRGGLKRGETADSVVNKLNVPDTVKQALLSPAQKMEQALRFDPTDMPPPAEVLTPVVGTHQAAGHGFWRGIVKNSGGDVELFPTQGFSGDSLKAIEDANRRILRLESEYTGANEDARRDISDKIDQIRTGIQQKYFPPAPPTTGQIAQEIGQLKARIAALEKTIPLLDGYDPDKGLENPAGDAERELANARERLWQIDPAARVLSPSQADDMQGLIRKNEAKITRLKEKLPRLDGYNPDKGTDNPYEEALADIAKLEREKSQLQQKLDQATLVPGNRTGVAERTDLASDKEDLKPGDPGTELGHAYEMYDGFTGSILDAMPEGGGKEDLKRFAQILRVTIVSDETLRQAQQLFVREVMTKEVPVAIKTAAVSGPVGVAAGAASVVGNAVHINASSEPVVERPNPVSVQPQVSSLGPGPAGVDQLPAPVSQDQPATLSPVMQILLSGASGAAELPHSGEASDSALPKAVKSVDPTLPEIDGEQPASASAVSAALAPLAIPGAAQQPVAGTLAVPTAAEGGVTNLGSVINNATNAFPIAGTVSAGASLAESPPVPETSHQSPVVVLAPETGSTGGSVFSGKAAVNPVLLNLLAGVSGIPEFTVKEGDTVPKDGVYGKITDPENASRIRALATEIALIDAQLAGGSVNAAEYVNFQFKKESLARELRERNYQEELRTLKASHPLKVVKLTRGQVNQGDVAVHGVELDAGQISFRLPIQNADFDDAELQINEETVRVLRYDLTDFDPVSGQFLLTINFVSPSGAGHDPQIAYTLKLDRRHEQGANDPALGKNKPFRVMVPHRESVPVTVPVAPGVPGGVFHALVPEGTIVSAGTPVGFIDASGYQQEQLDAAKGLQTLVGEISAANQNFAAVSPEELRRLNAEAALRIASLEGVDPKIVIRAPVAGRVAGLIPAEGQTVIPGKTTGIRILSSLVPLGSTDLADSDHLIDVPKGSVREGERVRVRTPLGNVLDGRVFKVQPLADENGLWLSDRDALVVQVEDPAGQLGDDMPVEIWTGVPSSEKEKTPAPAAGLAALPLHYGSDLPPAVLYQLLRHPDQNLSGSVRSVLAGEGSFRQILSSWKYFFGSPKGLASFGEMIRTGLLLVIGTIVSLWAGIKIVRSLKQKLKWLNPQGRLNDLALETRELQIRLEQKGQTQDKELLEDVITSVNEWIRILSDGKDLDHERLSTILIKAQELAGNKHLAFSKMKFQDLGMWKDSIGDDLVAIYGILTVLSILTARRIAVQSKAGSSKAPMELHELHRFQQGIVDYGDIFNESYALAHHLIGMSQTMDLYPPKVVRGLKPLSFFDRLKILHNRLVRFFYPVARMWLWVSPVVFLHKMDTLRSYRSLGRKMERLGLKTPEDTKRDTMNARQGLTYALNSQVTLDQPAGSKMAMHYGRFWRRFLTILGISSLFLPTVVLTFLGLHWLTATALMSIGKIILPFATIGFHIIPILTDFSGRHHNAWDHELARLRRKNVREERSLPELPKPQAVPKNFTAFAMPRHGSEQIAMSKVLNALHEGAQDTDLEVVALVPPQYGENKAMLEQFIQSDVVLRRWAITVAESDGEFPGDAGLFFAARNIAKTGQKKFKIYWYPQTGIDFQTALSVFKINLGEAARMIRDLRAAGVRFGEVAFPGGNLISSSVGITKNGGHFVVQARHASLNEIESEQLPAILGRNGTSRLEIEQVLYSPQGLKQMMAAGPLHLGSGRVDLGNAALPQIPVPTGPIALVAETPEDHQTIQELLAKTGDSIRNLTGRFGPFRIGLLEDVVRPIAELSKEIAENSVTPPNPNLLVNRTVRLSDDSVVSPYDKLYTAISRFLWNGGNGNRRNLKAEAFIPPVSETVYVSGEDRQQLAQALGRVAANFPELVDRELSQKLREDGLAEAKAKLVFRDDAGRTVFEKKKPGYRRGLRSVDVAGLVTKDEKQVLQRRNYQIGNEPGRLDVAFAGHQDETDSDAEAAAQREFQEELLGGRHAVPSGLTFHAMGPEVQLEITHEGEKGLSVRKKSTAVFRVSLNGKPSWDDFLPGDNAVEIVGLTREELETALRETPGRFTARAFQLFTKLGSELAFSEPGTGMAGRPEQRSAVNQPPASRSELRNEIPPTVIPLPVAGKGGPSEVAVRFREKEAEIPHFQASAEIRILAAIVVAEKILAVNDEGLMSRLEASLEDRGAVSGRVAPALAALAGAYDVPVEVLKTRLESLLRQEQIQVSADDRIVFLDAGTVPAEYFKKLMNSPVPVVVLFDRRHQSLYDQVSKEQLRRNPKSGVLLVYAPDGVSTFVKRALQSGDAFLTASPRLNAVLTRFRNHGKADDIALITSGRAESQKVEADYVGHRYYYGDETLRLDPELIFYSLQLLLRSPELFRYGKGRNSQDAVSLIGLVLQQLAQEFQAKREITRSV